MVATMKKIALFPGQGSQHVGMAKDLLDQFKIARDVFEEASEASKKKLRSLCLDGPDSDLGLTENTQPCLLAASVAAFRVAETELGFKPDAVAGHSLGEYSALVCAGAFPLSTAAAWVVARGRAMQSAVPAGVGGMAAVLMLDDAQVDALCVEASKNPDHKVEPANYNAPGQVAVSGSLEALNTLKTLMAEKKLGRFTPLNVSAPFHSGYMTPARDQMAELFANSVRAGLVVSTPKVPYLPNRTARFTQESSLILDFLVEQVDHAVLWKQSMQHAIERGFQTGIEFGPGKVLQGLGKRISKELNMPFEVASTGDWNAWKELFQ